MSSEAGALDNRMSWEGDWRRTVRLIGDGGKERRNAVAGDLLQSWGRFWGIAIKERKVW